MMKKLRNRIRAGVIALYVAAANRNVQYVINNPSTADALSFGIVRLLG